MNLSRQGPASTPLRLAPGSGLMFAIATLACIVGVIALYYYFVQTATGQFIDETARLEAVDVYDPAGHATTELLFWLPNISLVMAAVVVLCVTVIRRRWTAGGIAVAACIGANVATQVLKGVLPYPDKGVTVLDLTSLPSGHTTLAASGAAAVFLVASSRWRPMAGFVGGTFAIASGASTLLYQGHRPADVVAAFLLVGAFMIPAGWLVLRHGGSWNAWDGFGRHVGSAKIWLTLPVLIGLASVGLAVYSLAMIARGPGQETSTTNYFWAGTAFIVMAGCLAIVASTSLFAYAARRRDSPEP